MQQPNDAVDLARRALRHLRAGTTDQAPATMQVPIDHYIDEARYAHEFDRVFKRLPLALALSVELPEPGSYLAQNIMGVPVLLVRDSDGTARVFLNACRHRGTPVCKDGHGKATRFVCPYHAWTYDRGGRLVGLSCRETFGEVDTENLGLTPLHCAERAGFLWACLTPGVNFDIDAWLGDFAAELGALDLGSWHLYEQRFLDGAGWKVTMDGYLEVYHHDTVHGATVGAHTIGNLLVHDTYGPHQRMVFGRKNLSDLEHLPTHCWDAEQHIRRVHSGFPNLSLSGILGGYCLVSQIYPGPTSVTTVTRQTVLTAKVPMTPEDVAAADHFSAIALQAVRDEDYAIAMRVQQGLRSGANTHFILGRNEPAVQHYHRMIDRYAAADAHHDT